MIEEIIKKLDFELPQISASFGSSSNFLNLLEDKTVYSYEMDYLLSKLLTHPGKVAVISPTTITFQLYESSYTEFSSIVFEEPYSVYDMEGRLLYRVTNHEGFFGHSILDKTLVLQSTPGQFYYLEYKTYGGGSSTILLIVNAYAIASNKKISTSPSLKEERPLGEKGKSVNTIFFTLTDGQRDNTLPGMPYFPVRTYFLNSPPAAIPNRSLIINHPLVEKTDYDLDIDASFIFNPFTSGWLVINQVTRSEEVPLEVAAMTGSGPHRFIESSPLIYYIGLSNEITLSQLNQSLRVVGRSDIESSSQPINLKVDLVQG